MRKLSEISDETRAQLASGSIQTADWTEWMATDMPRLARAVAGQTSNRLLRKHLLTSAAEAEGLGILLRLQVFGRAVALAFEDFTDGGFQEIALHRSDVVRQWAAYAVNQPERKLTLARRLKLTRQFAADSHMSVRECAWMAFRPHLIANLNQGLKLLERISRSVDEYERRFAIEVTRPRSVWGRHIYELKEKPELASTLLSNVCKDTSRYVRLAAGNWLNDASKSRPDWVREICSLWLKIGDDHTRFIVRRGLRTLTARDRLGKILSWEHGVRSNVCTNGGMPC
jgi:3-methyladenine DNA glycosylase AlkC